MADGRFAAEAGRLKAGAERRRGALLEMWKAQFGDKWVPAPFRDRVRALFADEARADATLAAARADVLECTGPVAQQGGASAATTAALASVLAPDVHDTAPYVPPTAGAAERVLALVEAAVHGRECEVALMRALGIESAWKRHFAEHATRTPDAARTALSEDVWAFATALRSQLVVRFVCTFMTRVLDETASL